MQDILLNEKCDPEIEFALIVIKDKTIKKEIKRTKRSRKGNNYAQSTGKPQLSFQTILFTFKTKGAYLGKFDLKHGAPN